MSSDGLHSMRATGRTHGTTESYQPLFICILRSMRIMQPLSPASSPLDTRATSFPFSCMPCATYSWRWSGVAKLTNTTASFRLWPFPWTCFPKPIPALVSMKSFSLPFSALLSSLSLPRNHWSLSVSLVSRALWFGRTATAHAMQVQSPSSTTRSTILLLPEERITSPSCAGSECKCRNVGFV